MTLPRSKKAAKENNFPPPSSDDEGEGELPSLITGMKNKLSLPNLKSLL
jgi:hypothetical protein